MALIIRCWLLFLVVIQICFLLPSQSQAGIFKDQESLGEAHTKAGTLKEKILPGKIVVSSHGRTIWSEFLSATPIGMPESPQTKTILSSAHNFLLWDTHKDWKESRTYKMYYYDFLGKEYQIIDAVTPANNAEAVNDIALYYLKENVSCNPLNTIDQDLPQDVNLSALCSGLSVVSGDPSICNFFGEHPYYLQNALYLNQNNIYAHVYSVDRALHLSNKYNEYRYSYLAKDASAPVYQTYAHDSGSSWFKENKDTGGYSLTALASEEQQVNDRITINALERGNNLLSEISFMDGIFTLKVHKLTKSRLAVNLFTPLAPHRDWIYRQIR